MKLFRLLLAQPSGLRFSRLAAGGTSMGDLNLPLRISGGFVHPDRFFIVDANGSEIAMAYDEHHAEICEAALEADANGTEEHINWDVMDVRKVWRQMNRYAVYLETQSNRIEELERHLVRALNAEKEVKGG